jgi:hypothetical protein
MKTPDQEAYNKEQEIQDQMDADSGAQAYVMSNDEAMEILGIDELPDREAILTTYKTKLDALDSTEIDEKILELVRAKNVLARSDAMTQIYLNNKFVFPDSPFGKETCTNCEGSGELYLFNRRRKSVPCNKCEDGEVWVQCRECKGSGTYTSKFPNGGEIKMECKRCKDSPEGHKGQVKVKCRVCRGTGTAQITVLDHTLKSTTPCPVCHELGFVEPKKAKTEQSLGNTVLAGDLADKLKTQIEDDQKTFDVDAEVEEQKSSFNEGAI